MIIYISGKFFIMRETIYLGDKNIQARIEKSSRNIDNRLPWTEETYHLQKCNNARRIDGIGSPRKENRRDHRRQKTP